MAPLSSLLRLFGLRRKKTPEERFSSSVRSACSIVSQKLTKLGVLHAVIGGVALGAHRVIRATGDVDFLIEGAREAEVNAMMKGLRFEELRRTADVSNYILGHQRVDFIHARRPYAIAMLKRAEKCESLGLLLPVATTEDIIALKLQARRNDPTRTQDTADIERLIEYNLDELQVEYVRQFFQLFECEAELDELLERYRASH